MTHFQLVKPSFRRVLWSTAAVALAVWLIAGSALFVDALVVSSDDPIPTTAGDYIRLYLVALLLWGPSLLLMVWFVSVPATVAVAVLVASARRLMTNQSTEPAPTGR
ncbi:hypothetical protein BST28_09635 [Mycolicibacter kumamotonensis]|uniref:Uncharacterized protein n=1 Tax=Mycolicibacter kumamotonensis TaxID=354243 RepID=A0A1X0E7L8_9MYCO|nr:hypothetical protein [Mycolicibacter kumamotonensis]ORA80318.1 hypothetical protein BST28_09635 [Mycolicibacter kumamotonensis]